MIGSGLGIESMTAEEFEMMMDGDADELDFLDDDSRGRGDSGGGVGRKEGSEEELVEWPADDFMFASQGVVGHGQQQQESLELIDDFDDVEMAPTQAGPGRKVRRPLRSCNARTTLTLSRRSWVGVPAIVRGLNLRAFCMLHLCTAHFSGSLGSC